MVPREGGRIVPSGDPETTLTPIPEESASRKSQNTFRLSLSYSSAFAKSPSYASELEAIRYEPSLPSIRLPRTMEPGGNSHFSSFGS